MSWLQARVNPLLKLRLLNLNEEWDGCCQERKHALAQYAAWLITWEEMLPIGH